MPRCLNRLLRLVLTVALFCTVTATARAVELTYLRIGTGSPSGTYFVIGGLLANAISAPPGSRPCGDGGSCGVPNLIASAQSTAGSLENIEKVSSGTLLSGLAQADLVYFAFNGTERFAGKRPATGLRVLANLYPDSLHIVVAANSKIRTLSDLSGKRVSLGEAESGTAATAAVLLDAAQLSPSRMKTRQLRQGEAIDALANGTLDAFFVMGGYPLPAVEDAARRLPIRLVPITPELVEKVAARSPVYSPAVIPAGTYTEVAANPTLQVPVQWLISADVDNETAFGLVRALWHPSTRKLLMDGHRQGSRIVFSQALDGVAVPLHPGAERFYRDKGLVEGLPDAPAYSGR